MDDVAREAGLARATVYLHFPSKGALYGEIVERDSHDLVAEIERALGQAADAVARIRTVFRVTLAHYRHRRLLWHALGDDRDFVLRDAALPLRGEHERRMVELLRGILEQGMREGSIRRLPATDAALTMFHAGRVLIDRAIVEGDGFPFDRLMKTLSDVIGYGILSAPTQRSGAERLRKGGRTG
jgi:AcrR family transcriptional regulator